MGIVSVLIALFLPALARVREQANRVKCAANLRSIGHAMTMYVQQSGYYPCYKAIALTPEGSARFAIWPTRLRVFMNGAREPFYCPSQDERCRWEDGNIPAAARGRADATLTNFGYELGERLLTLDDPIYFSYGYNFGGWGFHGELARQRGLGMMVYVGYPQDSASGELRASRVRSPSEMIAIADTPADGSLDFEIRPQANFVGTVHSRGANVLFCDGHVQWYPRSDLVSDDAGLLQMEKIRMWNNDGKIPSL